MSEISTISIQLSNLMHYRWFLEKKLTKVSVSISSSSSQQSSPPLICLGRAISLRVPLAQLRSTTYAFYPDETHSTIRRVFTPRNAPHTKRHFCGFCGTQLTFWSEESQEEAEWVCVSLWSLKGESLERLKDAGVLSGRDQLQREGQEEEGISDLEITNANSGRELQGTPWFEEMIEGSELGRIKRRKGGTRSFDGRSRVKWEVVEFEGDGNEEKIQSATKRKLDTMGKEDDEEMMGGSHENYDK